MSHSVVRIILAIVVCIGLSPTPTNAESVVGLGFTNGPRFAGSADERTEAVPLLDIEGERFIAKTLRGAPELGAYLVRSDAFGLAAIVSLDRGRKASDSAVLADAGAEDIDPFPSIGLVASHEGQMGPLPYELLVRPLRRLGDSDGWQVDVRMSVGVARVQRFSAQAHAQVTWANAAARASDFEAPGTPLFVAGSGTKERRIGLSADYRLGDRTRLLAQWERRELASSLRASPVVEDRGSTAITLGIVYAF